MFLVALIVTGFVIPWGSGTHIVFSGTDSVSRGRDIFYGEGCIECHSRLVRIYDRGAGPVADQLLLVNDSGLPGSSRIGPDLQNIAGKFPESLLKTRLTEPGLLQPATLMPSYAHLSPNDLQSLIDYLETPASGTSMLDAIRSRNNIEPAIPDEVLMNLSRYMDFESGLFISPLSGTRDQLIIGRGIYNSRCAACHGTYGDSREPAETNELFPGSSGISNPTVNLPPPTFNSDLHRSYSELMWYWRISEGVPGTSMPRWEGFLSEDALWFLVGYVTALSEGTQPTFPPEPDNPFIIDFPEDLRLFDNSISVVQDDLLIEPNESVVSEEIITPETDAEDASEEEGGTVPSDGQEETDTGGDESDATESAENLNPEEDDP